MSSNLVHFDTPLGGQNAKTDHVVSDSNGGFLKETIHILAEGYNRHFGVLEPGLWGFMQ